MSAEVRFAVGARPARRGSVAAELFRSGALWRALRWQPAVGGCAGAVALLAWRHDVPETLDLFRGLVLLVVLGAVFVLDDPGAGVVEAVPVPWSWRLRLRIAVASAMVGVAFSALWAALGGDVWTGAGVGLEGVTVLAVGLAAAAVALRYAGVAEPGVGATPIVLAFAAATAYLPARWALVVPPGPQWSAAHLRWALVLVIAVAVVVGAGRDRAARRPALSRVSPPSRS